MIRVLSWGMGTQSTALAVMSALGDFGLPKLDYVIAADTGWERQRTYEIRDFYRPWLEERGIPVEMVQYGDIRRLGAVEHVHMPFWTQDGGPLRHSVRGNSRSGRFGGGFASCWATTLADRRRLYRGRSRRGSGSRWMSTSG